MQTSEKELANILMGLEKRLTRIEEKLSSSPSHTQTFHIQEVNIESLYLEELHYHLDKIDIKELSGMLNLGNTFSPAVNSKKSKKKTVPEQNASLMEVEDDLPEKEINIKINGKQIVPKTFKRE